MYMQVGDLVVLGDCTTVPLTRISSNTIFSKSQNARKSGTLCNMNISPRDLYIMTLCRKGKKAFDSESNTCVFEPHSVTFQEG